MKHAIAKTFFLILFVCLGYTTQAQEFPYKLKGYLGVKGGESFTYELHLKDSALGYVNGYAYTYLAEGKDVKATIVGHLDTINKTLSIEEKSIIHNNGFTSKAVICLLQSTLSYQPEEGVLSGRLGTKTAGSGALPCSDGSLTFIDKAALQTLFHSKAINTQQLAKNPAEASIPKKIALNRDSFLLAQKTSATQTNPKPAPTPTLARITEGKDKSYQWNSNTVKIEVWDGTSEDGDKINILLNGNTVLAQYTLRNQKHKFTINLENNELNVLQIEALNIGSEPPNTANLRIWDGDISYDIIAHNQPEKKANIKLIRSLIP